MKRTEFSEEQVSEIITGYCSGKESTITLGHKFNVTKEIINRLLIRNGIELRRSGRRDLGGREVAQKKYHVKNKEIKNQTTKTWHKLNKAHRETYYAEWRKNNKEKIKTTRRNYERKRKAADPLYKLIANFRTAIYTALKEKDVQKSNRYFTIIGYTPEDLIRHLEERFTEGMNWENYGQWHVDHVKPISSFKFSSTTDTEFLSCWSLTNLQPLWGQENLIKGSKLNNLISKTSTNI